MPDDIGNTTELWKTIEEFPNYSVSTSGRVRKDLPMIRTPGGIIAPAINPCGYEEVILSYNGNRKPGRVHRLVGIAFLALEINRTEINHKNGVKHDNRVENLEWVTRSENLQHAYSVLGRQGMKGERHWKSKLTNSDIVTIRKLIADGCTQRPIAKMFGVKQVTIWRIAHRRNWDHIP